MVNAADNEHGRIATKFASALRDERFGEAHAILTGPLQLAMPLDTFTEAYRDMISYGSGPTTEIELMHTMEEWPPGRENTDLGWAYVAMWGEDFSEAVTVIVQAGTDGPRIRQIEWGRP